MPLAPGSRYATPATNDAEQKDVVAGITRPTIPGHEDLRVPASSDFKEPPAKVTASSNAIEPSA